MQEKKKTLMSKKGESFRQKTSEKKKGLKNYSQQARTVLPFSSALNHDPSYSSRRFPRPLRLIGKRRAEGDPQTRWEPSQRGFPAATILGSGSRWKLGSGCLDLIYRSSARASLGACASGPGSRPHLDSTRTITRTCPSTSTSSR